MTKSEIVDLFLQRDFISFSFYKVDGTVRHAIGTLNESYIKQFWTPKSGPSYEEPEDIIRYFDLDAEAWRSFRVGSFIGEGEHS